METCAIICTGPSARDFDLDKIKVPKIGVNWSYLGTESDVHVISNIILIRKYQYTIRDVISAPVIYSGRPLKDAFTPDVSLNYCAIRHLESKVPPIPKNYCIYDHGWVFAGGGPCALQAAISLGFNDIVFIGLDLDTSERKDCHFYSHESETRAELAEYSGYNRTQLRNAWLIQDHYFMEVSEGLKDQGIRVTTLGTSIVFPRGDFKELI